MEYSSKVQIPQNCTWVQWLSEWSCLSPPVVVIMRQTLIFCHFTHGDCSSLKTVVKLISFNVGPHKDGRSRVCVPAEPADWWTDLQERQINKGGFPSVPADWTKSVWFIGAFSQNPANQLTLLSLFASAAKRLLSSLNPVSRLLYPHQTIELWSDWICCF